MKSLFLLLLLTFSISQLSAQSIPKDYATLDSLWLHYENEYDYEQAVYWGKLTVEAAKREFGEDTLYGDLLNSLVVMLLAEEQIEEAEKTAFQAVDFWKKDGRITQRAYFVAVSNLATFHMEVDNYEEALILLEPLAKREEELFGKDIGFSLTLGNLASAYSGLGRHEEAVALQERALAIVEKLVPPIHSDFLVRIDNLAMGYADAEKYDKTEKMYERMLKIWEDNKRPVTPDFAMIFNNMGYFYDEQAGDSKKALEYYKRAVDMQKEMVGEEHPDYALALSNFAITEAQSSENYSDAEVAYKKVLAVYKKALGENSMDYVRSVCNLAGLYLDMDRHDEAMDLAYLAIENAAQIQLDTQKKLEQIIEIIQTTTASNFQNVMGVLMLLPDVYSHLYLKTKDKAYLLAEQQLLDTIMLMATKVKNSVAYEEDKLAILREINDISIEGIFNAANLWELKKERQYLERIYAFIESNKSALLSESLQSKRNLQFGKLPTDLLQKEQTLQKELKSLQGELENAKAGNTQQVEAIQQRLIQHYKEQEKFTAAIKAAHPQYFELKYAEQKTGIKDLQEKLLLPETAMLSYFIADGVVWLLCLTKNKEEFFKIPLESNVLEAQIEKLHTCLSNYANIGQANLKKDFAETAHFLYQQLLEPALKGKKDIKHLIIIPDGTLGHLPFETFLVQAPKPENSYAEMDYLLKYYKVSYSYSGNLILQNKLSPAPANNGKILAVAASYKKEVADRNNNNNRKTLNRSGRAVLLRKSLIELPAAANEVQNIKENFGAFALIGEEANEKTFKEIASEYNIIHLAMHGILNEKSPILSNLAFTENNDPTEDNFLEVHEISSMQLKAQLVVLSACETGYGRFRQGEGVVSLARSFMYAGVPSLVVSLWQVNDASTSYIMQFFYENLGNGMDKAAALQNAKLKYIQTVSKDNDMIAHPAFWAPFVLIGDDAPIRIATSGMGWWCFGGIGVFVLVVAGIFFRKQK